MSNNNNTPKNLGPCQRCNHEYYTTDDQYYGMRAIDPIPGVSWCPTCAHEVLQFGVYQELNKQAIYQSLDNLSQQMIHNNHLVNMKLTELKAENEDLRMRLAEAEVKIAMLEDKMNE